MSLLIAADADSARLPTTLPLFPLPIEQCHALNASPYLVPYGTFQRHYGASPARLGLLKSLDAALAAVRQCGAVPLGMLVGGSFLDATVAAPRDLDGVCFYQPSLESRASRLVPIQAQAKKCAVDVRFIPLGDNPLVALKACAFFAGLYAIDRRDGSASRGSLLVHWSET